MTHSRDFSVRADREKVRTISELQELNNVNELRRALGLINYMSKYIPDLATKSFV